jgi:hypothetical protein
MLLVVLYLHTFIWGSFVDPTLLKYKPVSRISYLAGSNREEIRAHLLFSTSKYVLATQHRVLVAIPIDKVYRMETPDPTLVPTVTPTSIPTPVASVTPISTHTPLALTPEPTAVQSRSAGKLPEASATPRHN